MSGTLPVRRRRGPRWLLAAFFVVSVPIVVPTVASADPWPWIVGGTVANPVEGPRPDLGTFHTYCFDAAYPSNATVKEKINLSMDTLEFTTQVDENFNNPCLQATDILVQQRFIAEGVLGRVNCREGMVSGGVCDSFRLQMGWGEIVQYADNDELEARHTACHEIGHTVALNHYPSPFVPASPDAPAHSCMRSGVWDTGADVYKNYGAHHIAHINAYF